MAKVLLVEDDNNLREIYEARLTAEGYEIITAQNGEEALSAAKQSKPDLVISDVMMPRISGFEMLDILRNTDELKNTKVIMLTALGQAEDRNRADNLGADKYLVKSQVTLEDIINAAKELLSEEPGQITMPTVVPQAPAAVPEEPVVVAPVATMPTVDTSSEPVVVATPTPIAIPEPVSAVPTATPISMPEPPVPTPATSVPAPAIAVPVIPTAQVDVPVVAEPSIVPEPVAAPMDTTVTVADPDPITQRVSPPAEPLESTPVASVIPAPAIAVPVTPTAQVDVPVVAEPSAMPEPTIAPPLEPPSDTAAMPSSEPQTLADEEAAIQAQIASFAANDQPPAPPVTPPSANDAILDDAINKLTAAPEAIVITPSTPEPSPTEQTEVTTPVAEPVAAPPEQPVTPPAPQPPVDTTSQISGRKVIQPFSDTETSTPNLDVLLAQEEAKEAAQVEANPQPIVTGVAPVNPPGPDPNSIAL